MATSMGSNECGCVHFSIDADYVITRGGELITDGTYRHHAIVSQLQLAHYEVGTLPQTVSKSPPILIQSIIKVLAPDE
jgi:hypothetical protein